MPQVALFGAARLTPQGIFEVYLGGIGGKPKYPLNNSMLHEYIREMFDFLMSDEHSRVVGNVTITKRTTKRRQKQVIFTYLGNHRILLTRKEGQYASLIFELPFSKGLSGDVDIFDQEGEGAWGGGDAYDEEVHYVNG